MCVGNQKCGAWCVCQALPKRMTVDCTVSVTASSTNVVSTSTASSPLVAGAGDRSLCDPPDQHPGVTRTPAGEDRPTGYQPHDAGAARLAARRAKALQHGSDSNR